MSNEDLVKRLREATSFSESRGYSGMANTIKQAADAIEELQRQNNELLFRCGQAEALIDYYQTGKLPSNEPPKGDGA